MKGKAITLTVNEPTGRTTALTTTVKATQYGPVAIFKAQDGKEHVIAHAATGYPLAVFPTDLDAARAVEWLLKRVDDWTIERRYGRAVVNPNLSHALAGLTGEAGRA